MSVVDTLEFDVDRSRPSGQADTREAPAWYSFNWDATKASAEEAYWDVPGRAQDTRNVEVGRAAAELAKATGKPIGYYDEPMPGEPAGYYPKIREFAFWRDLAAARRARPDLLDDFAKDRDAYDRELEGRFQKNAGLRAERMSRGGLLGNLAGGIAGAFTDPYNVVTLPLGGFGRTAAAKIVLEGLVNAGIEAAETPFLAFERRQQGRDLTLGEAGRNIALAGIGGAALTAAGIGLGKAASKGWDALPVDVKAGIALRMAKPDFAMTPNEAAAWNVISRGAEIDAESPFAHTYEALEAHGARIDQTLAQMARWPEASSTAALAPAARVGAMAGSGIRVDLDRAWNAIIGIEGGTNRDGSFRTSPAGAIGPAQVMPGTAPEAARLAGLPWNEAKYRSDPEYNLALGRAYYEEMLRQFDGDPVKAAAAYNAGPGSARTGKGVRGAMARAQRAGVPNDWASFLKSAETRAYVENFRRRTGAAEGAEIEVPAGEDVFVRPAALDAERPLVDTSTSPDLPELRRDMFGSDAEWQRAQGEVDAEAFGMDPAGARQSVWIEARDRLMTEKGGEVAGALWHPELGSIDVKWGDAGSGLAKIVQRHPEVLEDLPARLAEMDVVDRKAGRVTLESMDHTAVVRLDWDDKAQTWLLTAFQREEPKLRALRQAQGERESAAPSPEVSMRSGESAGASPTAGAMRDIALERAGIKLGEGVGDFGRMWDRQLAEEGRARPVHALVDRDGTIRAWETTRPRAARQLERLGLDGGRVVELRAPKPDEVRANSALRDEIEAEGMAGPVVADPELGKIFDDAGGDPIARQAELAWHDAQIAAAKRTAPEQLTFDLGDGRGERTIADIEAELKADEDAIATIESCLRPMGGPA